MTHLISQITNLTSSLLNVIQIKRLVAIFLVGFSLLTANTALALDNSTLKERVKEQVEQNDAQRPKTVGQWEKDARETEGKPGKRAQKIGQQSAEALKEFGSGYVEGAKETASEIGNAASQAGDDISRKIR